jgi:5-methylcytosine-specific restriction endonuclease McrA
MLAIDIKRISSLIRKYKNRIDAFQQPIRQALTDIRPHVTNTNLRRYLRVLINNEDKLITGSQYDLQGLKDELDDIVILDPENNDQHWDFKERILTALRYNQRRKDFYPEFFRGLAIKACIYCNSQLCITAENDAGILSAKFQVDHHLPKSVYPGFSIWLVNLVPVCSSCNNKKSSFEIDFVLYEAKNKLGPSQYRFELLDKAKTVAGYINNRDSGVIKIKFHEPPLTPGKRSLNDLFAIEGIYDTQLDIVEELILKAHIYDNSLKLELMRNFGALFNNSMDELEKLIISNYTEENEIHNRPISKFTQDIARQLGLIK